jgi:hypothetical protein
MNKHDLVQQHGFRPGTGEDFMLFNGAESDSIFKYQEAGPDVSCSGIYSESAGAYSFYCTVGGGTDQLFFGLEADEKLVSAICAAAFDEWAELVKRLTAETSGQESLVQRLEFAGFNRL